MCLFTGFLMRGIGLSRIEYLIVVGDIILSLSCWTFPSIFLVCLTCVQPLVLRRGLNALLVFGLWTLCWIMDLLPYNWSFSHPKMVNKAALSSILYEF